MTDPKTLIEDAAIGAGLTITGWGEDEDGLRANLGRYVMTADVDPGMGPFEGEEGDLFLSVVGAPQHGNQRAAFQFMADGTDVPSEIDPADGEPAT